LLAALMVAPKPITVETFEALTGHMTAAERCEFEAQLPPALASEMWRQLAADIDAALESAA
jgi:hypothetical protein